MSRTAETTLWLSALAACALAPASAEARDVLVCHSDWARCVTLEAIAPAYVEGRTIRMEAPGAAFAPSDPERGYRDYYFTDGGYYIRDAAGVAFQAAEFNVDGRLCASGGSGGQCAYLVRLAPDRFGAGASNAVCFAAETDDPAVTSLVQCAVGEWGGDRFNLRVRSMVSNLFGRGEEAPSAAGTRQMSCAYVAQADGAYELDCSGARGGAAAPAGRGYAAAPAAAGAGEESCAYEARGDGQGFVLNCTVTSDLRPGAIEAAPQRGGVFAFMGGGREDEAARAPACAYVEQRGGGFQLVCE